MSGLLVGYARCSTDQQDITAQRDALLAMGDRFAVRRARVLLAGPGVQPSTETSVLVASVVS